MPPDPDDDQAPSGSPGAATRRLEAFSDAVFAIAITLLALNLRVPELAAITPQASAAAMAAQWPTYLGFVLSFATLLIAWVYHHRLLQGTQRAGTAVLFTNGALLLVVAAVPFPTALLGAFLATPAASVVCAIYAGYIGLLNLTYNLLWWQILRQQAGYIGLLHFTVHLLGRALWWRRTDHRHGWRPPASMLLSYLGMPCYAVAAAVAFWSPAATLVICGGLWVVWTIMAPMLAAEE